MKEIDYDHCYIVLSLKPGAALAEIETSWKELARLMHPDNYLEGPLKDKATRRLQDLNNARDNLRAYWHEHGAAPPSKLGADGKPSQSGKYSTAGKHDKTGAGAGAASSSGKQKQAGAGGAASSSSNEQNRTGTGAGAAAGASSASSGGAAPQPSKWTSKPVGPPPVEKNWKYDLFNWMFFSHGDSATLALPAWGVVYLGPFLLCYVLVINLMPVLGFEPGLLTGCIWIALSLICAIPFWKMFQAETDIFRVRKNPFLKTVGFSSAEALRTVRASLDSAMFAGKKWIPASTNEEADGQSLSCDYHLDFSEGDRRYKLRLHLRILNGNLPNTCLLCFWFEVEAASDWLLPASKVIKESNEHLSRLFS